MLSILLKRWQSNRVATFLGQKEVLAVSHRLSVMSSRVCQRKCPSG